MMQNFLVHLRKEWIRRLRAPGVTLSMIAFPIVLAGLIGMVSGDPGSGPTLPTVELALVDEDSSVVGGVLKSLLGGAEGMPLEFAITQLNRADATSAMGEGDYSAMVILPEGLVEAILQGGEAEIEVLRNPSEGIKPELVSQGMEIVASLLDLTSKILGPELRELDTIIQADEMPELEQIMRLSQMVYARILEADGLLLPPIIELEQIQEAEEDSGPPLNIYAYILVMAAAMSGLFIANRGIFDLLQDEKDGTLRRQLVAPVSPGRILDARLFFAVLFVLVAMAVLMGLAVVLGWISWDLPWLAIFFHTACFALAACGLLALVLALTRNEKQAELAAIILIMGMSLMGGSFLPAANMTGFLKSASQFTLNYWAIEGWLDLVVLGRDHAWIPSLVLGGVGLASLILGRQLLMRRFAGVRL